MNQEERKEIMYRQGRAHALDLRQRAAALTGTEIIDQEKDVPVFVAGKNYTDWPVGSPVADGGQVWQLLQPYDSAAHPGQPADLRALWGLCHTKNPAMAKPWVFPYGTSGMYMAGECYRGAEGTVYRCLADDTVYDAEDFPSLWEEVQS